jgi:DNA-binding response OmpR family regulator
MVLLLPKGHDGAGDRAEAYMTPPFTSRKLLYRINKLARQISPRHIQRGELILDTDAQMLYRNGSSWHLRPKETALLAMLMSNEGRVVSRQEIMNKVWETDYMADTRTLNVHVCWLRSKIEADRQSPRILRTVRGRGYLFNASAT